MAKQNIWPQKAVKLLSDMVAIPSVNPGETLPGKIHLEGKMASYLYAYYNEQPFPYQIRLEEVLPGRPNVIVNTGEDPKKRTLLLETHMDTVDTGNMIIEPFEPVFRDGKLFGRGACDAKGQLTAMMLGLEMAIEEAGDNLPINVILAATVDEEHLHRGVDEIISVPLDVDGAIVGEPTEMRLVIATKGSIRFQIRTTGIPVHSSSPREGVNAIYIMSDVIQFFSKILVPYLDAKQHPLCGYSAVSVTLINGGHQVNIIPDHCVIDVDRRLLPGEDWEDAYSEIKEMLMRNVDPKWHERIEIGSPYLIDPSLETNVDASITRAMSAKLDECGLLGEPIGAPFGTDASKIALKGIPSVVFGPGSIKQAHTKDEYIEIADIIRAAEVYKKVILSFNEFVSEGKS
jgi:acetylornithine deacetylase/succinyl-diaminopimelate desuccinylase family protein